MLQYVNGFSCSVNQNTGSFVIHFIQKEPVVQDDESLQIVENQIASIIMDKDSAEALYDVLKENLETDDEA